MPESIGTITNIKLGTLLAGGVNEFDLAMVTLRSAAGFDELFFLWISRNDEAAVERIRHTQRLALAREAALRQLQVHLFHGQEHSGIVDEIQVDFV
jgi:hypothetical protein